MNKTFIKEYILLSIVVSIILAGCAQFVPPTGGKRDIIPPELISSNPSNETLNFEGNTITLAFNELIDASSLRQELIITPQPDGAFDLKAKPFEVTLKFEKGFKDSTTYTFNFRNGIKDLNERNPAKNLKFVFSTGNEIDSLQLSGNIKYLWTGQIAENVLVALYDINSKDSVPLLNRKPNYFINTDTSGSYKFENLKSSDYRIISFADKNSNLLFDQEKEFFGFIPDTIKLDTNKANVDFQIYSQDRSELKVKRTLARQNNFSIAFNKPYDSLQVFFPNNDSITYQLRDQELLFYRYPIPLDTILTNIIVQDSVGNKLEFLQKIYFQEQRDKNSNPEELRISTDIKPNIKLKKPIAYNFNFEYPITQFDTSQFTLIGDTTFKESYTYEWLDNSHTNLRIITNPIATREIKLSFLPSSLTNYKLDTNDTYTLINSFYPQSDYGLIEGKVSKSSSNQIIQLIDAKSLEIIDYQYITEIFIFEKVIPGNYYLRIINDLNNNGRWDTSDFEKNRKAEQIYIYPELLKLKANFEIRGITINNRE